MCGGGAAMPTVQCSRHDCLYNDDGVCTCGRIELRAGKCRAYTHRAELTALMGTKQKANAHREKGRFKNNTGRVVR